MKKLLSILLLFVSFGVLAQTYDTLPTGSKPYGNFYLGPDGNLVFGNVGLKYRVLGTKKRVDSLLALKAPIAGSANYIQNNNTGTPQSASFNINGIGRFDSPSATTLFGAGVGSFATENSVTSVNGGALETNTLTIKDIGSGRIGNYFDGDGSRIGRVSTFNYYNQSNIAGFMFNPTEVTTEIPLPKAQLRYTGGNGLYLGLEADSYAFKKILVEGDDLSGSYIKNIPNYNTEKQNASISITGNIYSEGDHFINSGIEHFAEGSTIQGKVGESLTLFNGNYASPMLLKSFETLIQGPNGESLAKFDAYKNSHFYGNVTVDSNIINAKLIQPTADYLTVTQQSHLQSTDALNLTVAGGSVYMDNYGLNATQSVISGRSLIDYPNGVMEFIGADDSKTWKFKAFGDGKISFLTNYNGKGVYFNQNEITDAEGVKFVKAGEVINNNASSIAQAANVFIDGDIKTQGTIGVGGGDANALQLYTTGADAFVNASLGGSVSVQGYDIKLNAARYVTDADGIRFVKETDTSFISTGGGNMHGNLSIDGGYKIYGSLQGANAALETANLTGNLNLATNDNSDSWNVNALSNGDLKFDNVNTTKTLNITENGGLKASSTIQTATNFKIPNTGASGGNWVIDSDNNRFRFYNDVTGYGFELNGNTLRDVGGSNPDYLKNNDNVAFAGLSVSGNVSLGSPGSITRILSFGIEADKPLIVNDGNLSTATNISMGSGDLTLRRSPSTSFLPVLIQGEATKSADTVSSAPSPTSSGTKGDVIVTGGYRYECISTNTWTRTAIETTW